MGVTVSAKLVLLPHDWNERSAYRKALLLLHELVHVRQWRKYLFFGARWSTSPRFRVAMEAQAYRESVSAMVMLGYSDDSIADYINRLSVTFHKTYHTGNVDVDIGPCLRDSVSEAQIGLRG